MKKLIYLIVILYIGLADAKVYPAHANVNSDVIYVRDPFVEVLLKEKLILNAKKEILIIQHEHQPDYTGKRLIVALKKAAAKGVKVRYLYEKIATMAGGDFFSRSQELLLSSKGEAVPEVINLGFMNRALSSFPFTNLLHAKMLAIDPGTENETIYFGGRNAGDKYLNWFDAGFLMRPINYKSSYVGNDLVSYFNSYWVMLTNEGFSKEKSIAMSSDIELELKKAELSLQSWQLPGWYQSEVNKIIRALNSNETLEYRFQPKEVFFVTNDLFMKKHSANGAQNDVSRDRVDEAVGSNDIIKEVGLAIERANEIYYNSLTFSPVPVLLESIKKSLLRGVVFYLFTNEDKNFRSAFKDNDLLSLGAEIKTVRSFTKMDFKKDQDKKVQFYIFTPKEKRYQFLHRKLLLTDKILLTGSDNFSYASTFYCDEIILGFKDSKMINFFINEHKFDMVKNFNLNLRLRDRLAEDNQYIKRFLYGLLEPILYDLVL